MNKKTADAAKDTTILIAEDSATQAEQLRFLLEQQGYTVEAARNGRQALEMLRAKRPTMVITDVVMPEMDGYQLCAAIKADEVLKDIPVVIVTSLSGLQDIAKSLECGADNFLRKPYDPAILLSRVNYILLNNKLRSTGRVRMGMELYLDGKKHFITSDREQIIDLLVSTYEEAIRMNDELQERHREIARSNQVLLSLYRIAEGMNHVSTSAGVCQHALQGISMLPCFSGGWVELADAYGGSREGLGEPLTPAAGMPEPIMVPLIVGKQCLGTLNVLPVIGSIPGTEDLKALDLIANGVAVALDRVKLQSRLEQRATQLEYANKELESFSYSVSHDLRSPLRAIDGFAGMLERAKDSQLGPEGSRMLHVIRENSHKMGQLINDLLSFSRLGSVSIRPQAIDMTAQAQEVFDELQNTPDSRPVQLEIGPLPKANGDAALIRQVWVNLISNAIKYSGKQAGPVVTISAETVGPELVYKVSDNGAGFDMRYSNKLFGVFQRLHHVDEFPGTGIGLANVQRVIVRHGGRVWAEGEVGKGASFYFALPGKVAGPTAP